jgi:hypothetical protein
LFNATLSLVLTLFKDPDFDEDEELYDELNLDEEEELYNVVTDERQGHPLKKEDEEGNYIFSYIIRNLTLKYRL